MHRRTNAGGCRIALHLTAVLLVLSLAGRRAHAEATEPGANDYGTERTRTEPLPIVMYDTDVGVGYGAKLFLLNHLHHAESLDMVVFNSTKGQRWVRLLFSSPDFEDRQGEEYPLSLDLFADYDARIKASFFGVGPAARQDDRETYRREALDMSVTLGRGFSPSVVGQAALRYRSVRHGDFGAGSHLQLLPPRQNAASASWASLVLSLRRDTCDSFVNPTRGLVLQTDGEFAPR